MSGGQQPDVGDEARRVARLDAPPDEVREAARNAYSGRERDSLVLPLVSDWLIDGDGDSVAAWEPRVLVFQDAGIRVDLRIGGGEKGRRVIANVDGARVLTAAMRTPSEQLVLASDAQNRFARKGVPPGPVTLLLEVEGPPPSRWHTECTVI
jgi:hypothetical protein